MKPKLFSLAFDTRQGSFDGEEVEAFCEDVDVVSHSEHFFLRDRDPHLLLVVWYREKPASPSERPRSHKETENPRDGLKTEEKERYEALREWRSEQAKVEKVAVFMVLTNRQIAAIARSNPATKAALQEVKGVGKVTMDKYADAILAHLHAQLPSQADEGKTEKPERKPEEAP